MPSSATAPVPIFKLSQLRLAPDVSEQAGVPVAALVNPLRYANFSPSTNTLAPPLIVTAPIYLVEPKRVIREVLNRTLFVSVDDLNSILDLARKTVNQMMMGNANDQHGPVPAASVAFQAEWVNPESKEQHHETAGALAAFVAGNIKTSLEAFPECQRIVVFSDLDFQRSFTGVDFCRELNLLRDGLGLPLSILGISGSIGDDPAPDFQKAGADGLLYKPEAVIAAMHGLVSVLQKSNGNQPFQKFKVLY